MGTAKKELQYHVALLDSNTMKYFSNRHSLSDLVTEL